MRRHELGLSRFILIGHFGCVSASTLTFDARDILHKDRLGA
jgi:hypothetical protein